MVIWNLKFATCNKRRKMVIWNLYANFVETGHPVCGLITNTKWKLKQIKSENLVAGTQVCSPGLVRVIWSVWLYWEGSLHTGVQSWWYGVSVCTEKKAYTQVYSHGDMECLSVLRRKPTHRCTVRVIWSVCLYWEGSLHTGVQSWWYGVPVCTEKEAYTQVYSQVDMECLSVLRRKPTHRCTVNVIWSVCLYWEGSLHTGVQSWWYGVPVCTEKKAYTQVYSQGDEVSVCTEKEAYTQVYSQGDMECLSVLRRKPTHRCTVRVIWSACLYWEGSLHTGVQSGWYGVSVCTEKEAYTQVYSQGDGVPVCTEKEAYTQVYSQGLVRVIWSVCLYWEGNLHTGVQSGEIWIWIWMTTSKCPDHWCYTMWGFALIIKILQFWMSWQMQSGRCCCPGGSTPQQFYRRRSFEVVQFCMGELRSICHCSLCNCLWCC